MFPTFVMLPQYVVEQLLLTYPTSAFHKLLDQFSSDLSPLIIDIFFDRVLSEYLQNARQALRIVEVAEHVANMINQDAQYADISWMKGIAYSGLNLYELSLEHYRQAEQYFRKIDDTLRVAGLQINQMNQLNYLGRYKEALELCETAEQILDSNNSEKALRYLANLENGRANLHYNLGQYEPALRAYSRARRVNQDLSNEWGIASVDINRSIVLRSMQRFDEAHGALKQAQITLQELGYTQEVARTDLNFGVLSYLRGHYQSALEHFTVAYNGFASIPEPIDMAVVDLYRSFVYRDLNLLSETIQMAKAASSMMHRSKLPWQHAFGLMNQGSAYERLGDLVKSEKLLEKARRLLFQLGAMAALQQLDTERTRLALKRGQAQTAVRIARRVLKQIEPDNNPALAATLYLLLAQCVLDQPERDLAVAQAYIEEASELAEQYHLLKLKVQGAYLQGVLCQRRAELGAAQRHLQTAVFLINQWQQDLQWDEFRVGFMVDKLHIYETAVSVVNERVCRGETAVAELLHILNASYTPLTKAQTHPDPDKQAQIDHLRQRWHWLQSQLEGTSQLDAENPAESRVDTKGVFQELKEVEQTLAEQLRQAQAVSPTSEVVANPAALSPEQLVGSIQQRLGEQEMIWHYYVANQAVHAVVVTAKESFHFPDLSTLKALSRLQKNWQFHIRYLATVLAPRGIDTAKTLLHQFHQQLVTPLAALNLEQPIVHLRLPPELSNLPFAACYDGEQYLIEQRMLSLIQAPSQLLTGSESFSLNKATRAAVVGYSDGGRLQAAVPEATWVRETLEFPPEQTQLLLEDDAQAGSLLAFIPTADLIHLSTHAIFRSDNPFFSWIRLADSRLTVNDLYQLQLEKRPLIFLSACETGKDQPRGGSSLGMARALLAAGAGQLVVSRWPLIDTKAAQIVKNFYTQLLQISDVPHALAQAQRQAVLRNEHPFFWAGYAHLSG